MGSEKDNVLFHTRLDGYQGGVLKEKKGIERGTVVIHNGCKKLINLNN
jgi:hypothetical protein